MKNVKVVDSKIVIDGQTYEVIIPETKHAWIDRFDSGLARVKGFDEEDSYFQSHSNHEDYYPDDERGVTYGEEGWSYDDVQDVFDGDPEAIWNVE